MPSDLCRINSLIDTFRRLSELYPLEYNYAWRLGVPKYSLISYKLLKQYNVRPLGFDHLPWSKVYYCRRMERIDLLFMIRCNEITERDMFNYCMAI